jgi:hypothetical protein
MRSMARMSPVGLLGEFVGAVAGADGDGQRVAVGLLDEVGGLVRVGQQLFAGHVAFGAVAVFLVALHGFQRTEHAEFGFDRNADGVGELDGFTGDGDVVFVGRGGLAIGFQRAVHHHRGKAGADGAHADGRALAVVLVHDDGEVRVGFEGGENLVAQEGFAGIFAGAGRGLHDDRGVDQAGGFADGPDLFHIVDVESGQTVAIFGGVVEQLAHGYERHGNSCSVMCLVDWSILDDLMLAHADDLQGVGAAGAADRFANGQGDQVALLDDAAVDQELLGFGQQAGRGRCAAASSGSGQTAR